MFARTTILARMIVAGSFIKHLKEKAKKKEKKKEIISLRPNTVNAKFFYAKVV